MAKRTTTELTLFHGKISTIKINNKLSIGHGVNALRDSINKSLGVGHNKIILDISNMPYCDSIGLGEIVRGYTLTKRSSGEFVLCAPQEKFMQLINVIKFNKVFMIYDTLNNAFAYFQKNQTNTSQNSTFKNNTIIFTDTTNKKKDISCDIRSNVTEDYIVELILEGHFNTNNFSKISSKLKYFMNEGYTKYILDCRRIKFISKTGCCELKRNIMDVREKGGDIVFIGRPDRISKIKSLSNLLDNLKVYINKENALEYLKTIQVKISIGMSLQSTIIALGVPKSLLHDDDLLILKYGLTRISIKNDKIIQIESNK